MNNRSGGKILVEALRAHGVKRVFCVPGESYLDVLDALSATPDVHTVTCRHEGGAAFMAEAYAKLTGNPGVCFVTRGPGACNASIGVHTAMQDSTPMVLFIGQVAREHLGREAFQEIDYREMFRPPMTKWVLRVEEAADLPAAVQKAFETATTGRPGPVVVTLPEDMLCEESDVLVPGPMLPAHFAPRPADLAKMKEMLLEAERPLAIIGGGSWTDAAVAAFEEFCARACIPVAVSFRRQDCFHNSHDCYAGALGTTVDPRLLESVEEADLILAVGTRLGEIPTQGYTIITAPRPLQKLIHVYPDSAELNRVYKADLAIHATVREFAKAVKDMDAGDPEEREPWRMQLREDYLDWVEVRKHNDFLVDMDGIIEDIRSSLPADAIITTDAGNFSGWAQRYILYDRPMRLLAPTSGAMGYGVPAAVAASIAAPNRTVVGFTGDGGFLMTGQEMATAMQQGARPILLVFDNGMYGTIRMHQEKAYPGRVSATDLVNPDFAALAQSFGAIGVKVEKTEDFLPVFRRALETSVPFLIHIKMEREQISTGKTLSELQGG